MSNAQPIRNEEEVAPVASAEPEALLAVLAKVRSPEDVLQNVFGYREFRPGQKDVVETLLNGQSVLAVMPTGAGKSICFQVPALALGGLTIVVSPLVALMEDQVAALKACGVAAECIHSSKPREDNVDIWHKVTGGSVDLLYMAPERLMSPRMLAALQKLPVRLIAIDEAHCISRWGASFRPEYAALCNLGNHFQSVPIAAMTATADEETRRDIHTSLFSGPYKTFVSGFDRPNIHLAARRKAGAKDQLLDFISDHPGESGIVYCLSRKKVEEHARFLREQGYNALAYHAGLDAEMRAHHQDRFLTEAGVIMVATIAFGMGIDKSDVRFVFHMDLPSSMEAYYQEIGRAGRDGQPAEAMMLFGPGDIRLRRQFLEAEFDDPDRAWQEEQRLQALIRYADATQCRRAALLAYFGEEAEPCGNCDRCDNPVAMEDATQDACLVISAVQDTGQRYGQAHIIDLLLGDPTEKAVKAKHDCLPCFGEGQHRGKAAWRDVLRQMLECNLLEIDGGGYASVLVTKAGETLMRGDGTFEVAAVPHIAPSRGNARRAKATRLDKGEPAPEPLSERDQSLLTELKSKRLDLAKARNVPAYVVFSDRTLEDMARQRPECLDDFRDIRGVGAKKLATFADAFLDIIQTFEN